MTSMTKNMNTITVFSMSVKVWGIDRSIGPQRFRIVSERSSRSTSFSTRFITPDRSCLFRLVILDYLMLNTDRGLDNFMIKCCDIDHEKAPVDSPPTNTLRVDTPQMSEIRKPSATTSGVVVPPTATPSMSALGTKGSGTSTPSRRQSHIHIAAIDNSLSFPHEHPRGWRSYTYGWLYLPVSIIGRPFSEGTRNHFLPLLTSKSWWEETSWQLREIFALDPDFHPKMFNVCFPSVREDTPLVADIGSLRNNSLSSRDRHGTSFSR